MSAVAFARCATLVFAFSISALSGHAHAVVDAAHEPSAVREAPPAHPAGPFGLATSLLPQGPLRSKWQDVAKSIEAEQQTIAECRANPDTCTSAAASRFLGIVNAASAYTGLARVGQINRAFNLAIRPMSDLAQHGVEDQWSSPLATLSSGAGDCEDYAIAKLVALREAGFADDDLRLIIMRETVTGEDHAVLAVRFDGRWRLLDNRTFVMVEDRDLAKYKPVFAIDTEGVKRFEQPAIVTVDAPRETQPSPLQRLARSGEQAVASLVIGPEIGVTLENLRPTLAM